MPNLCSNEKGPFFDSMCIYSTNVAHIWTRRVRPAATVNFTGGGILHGGKHGTPLSGRKAAEATDEQTDRQTDRQMNSIIVTYIATLSLDMALFSFPATHGRTSVLVVYYYVSHRAEHWLITATDWLTLALLSCCCADRRFWPRRRYDASLLHSSSPQSPLLLASSPRLAVRRRRTSAAPQLMSSSANPVINIGHSCTYSGFTNSALRARLLCCTLQWPLLIFKHYHQIWRVWYELLDCIQKCVVFKKMRNRTAPLCLWEQHGCNWKGVVA